ncbi:MAG: hypothetical protein ABLT11_12250, partial [Candidatus Acidiferrum sp.]
SHVSHLVGIIGRNLVALGVLALTGPAGLKAQVGLASGLSTITLTAAVPPRASISSAGPARETARLGNLREDAVRLRLSANAGYRLVVVGTGVAGRAEPTPGLWVRVETGQFVEVRSGAAVTVIRGRHGVADSEHAVTFRRKESGQMAPPVLPVRYEVRIDPTI